MGFFGEEQMIGIIMQTAFANVDCVFFVAALRRLLLIIVIIIHCIIILLLVRIHVHCIPIAIIGCCIIIIECPSDGVLFSFRRRLLLPFVLAARHFVILAIRLISLSIIIIVIAIAITIAIVIVIHQIVIVLRQ